MNNINMGRVILGGLLAGLVLNIGEFLLNAKVLESQMKEYMTRHNFPDPGGNFIIIAVVLTFVLGIVIVLGYACIRTRLGPGVKTAIIAGLFAWFGIYFYSGIINGVLFGIPMGTMVMIIVWGLVEYSLAAIAGAWLYKES
jgi:glucan phosphoethanolaminetransferase (alkaline phosphatase superfamily)